MNPGGADRTRTGDMLLAKQPIYQLIYGPLNQRRVSPRTRRRPPARGGSFGRRQPVTPAGPCSPFNAGRMRLQVCTANARTAFSGPVLHGNILKSRGRGRGIRTPGILLPKQVHCQAVLVPGDRSETTPPPPRTTKGQNKSREVFGRTMGGGWTPCSARQPASPASGRVNLQQVYCQRSTVR